MWAILIFDAVAAMFVGMSIAGLLNLRWMRRLPALDELTAAGRESGKPIRCSVVIAARNEAARIEQTLRHVMLAGMARSWPHGHRTTAQFMRRLIPFLAALALVSGCNRAGVRGDGVIVTTNVTVAEFSTLKANGAYKRAHPGTAPGGPRPVPARSGPVGRKCQETAQAILLSRPLRTGTVRAPGAVRGCAPYKIEWSPGQPALAITTDSNLLPLITTTLSGNTLKIDQQQNLRPTRGITIVVSSAALKGVELNGAVTLTASNVSGGEFKLEAHGASSIRVAGSVTNLAVDFSGASSLNAKGLSAQKARLSISGASSADVTATESLDVSISGAGTVTYGGNPKKVNKDVSGVGTIKAR